MKPVLLRHHRVRFEPADDGGEDALVFTSERRRVVLRGTSFGVFVDRVVPLLDGGHTLEEIQERLAGVLEPRELEASVRLLRDYGIVEDASADGRVELTEPTLEPQLSYLREVSAEPARVLDQLAESTVTIVGLGSVGAVAARALAATAVGTLRLVDAGVVSPADVYLAQVYELDEVGSQRVDALQRRLQAVSRTTNVELLSSELATERDVAAAVAGSSFVLGCLDPGLTSLTYKLNRICLDERITWSSATASAFEGVVGPTVVPYETACYLCYQMRVVACRDDPADALAELHDQDRRKVDFSPHRESLAFGASIVGNLLGLEAFRALTGSRPATQGRILTFDFTGLTSQHHVVLRKPWCPACFTGAHG